MSFDNNGDTLQQEGNDLLKHLAGCACALLTALVLCIQTAAASELHVHFLDIDRNDGILIECDGEAAFIDSGTHDYGLRAVEYMEAAGVKKLKYYIGTHAHRDHVGGGAPIILRMKPEAVLVPHAGVRRQIKKQAANAKEKAAVDAAAYTVVSAGERYTLGASELLVLGPLEITEGNNSSDLENENSLVLRLTLGKYRFLLTADSMATSLHAIEEAAPGSLDCDVLKNPHHNSRMEDDLFAACSPEYVIFSTSDKYQPPAPALEAAVAMGAVPLITSTSKNGTVVFTTDGETLSLRTANEKP